MKPVAGWCAFVAPEFAYFKIGAFIILEVSLATLLIVVIASLIRAQIKLRQG